MASDETEIRELLTEYVLRLDVDDTHGCLSLFADDGEFEVYGKVLSRERILKMFTRAPRGMHMMGAARIQVDGDAAKVRSQVIFVDSTTHCMRPALYDDQLRKADGRWRIRRRRCQFLTATGLSDSPEEPVA